jgi:hypothetical protein
VYSFIELLRKVVELPATTADSFIMKLLAVGKTVGRRRSDVMSSLVCLEKRRVTCVSSESGKDYVYTDEYVYEYEHYFHWCTLLSISSYAQCIITLRMIQGLGSSLIITAFFFCLLVACHLCVSRHYLVLLLMEHFLLLMASRCH